MTDATTSRREVDPEVPVRHIFRWDLDKTYLRTEFDTVRDLIRTAFQAPEEKVNVPGAVALLRELTREDEAGRSLVTFISGSPSQMRKTLEKKFELDGIRPDAFILKPTLRHILRGRFRAVRGQVGYKLDALLRLRQRAPSAPETLFGDDAEQDAFIYSLYADLVAGRVDREQLVEILEEAQVYESTAETILTRFEQMHIDDTVDRIFIHLDRHSAPGRFWVFGPSMVPITNYFQAAVVLYADRVLAASRIWPGGATSTWGCSIG
ncbi:MAG: phosphatase domain-containing protein [Phycisphaeraceae bacterium]